MTESVDEQNTVKEMVSSDICKSTGPRKQTMGGHLMTGIRRGSRNGIDFTIGAGYSFIIWKVLGLSLAYETVFGQVSKDGFYKI